MTTPDHERRKGPPAKASLVFFVFVWGYELFVWGGGVSAGDRDYILSKVIFKASYALPRDVSLPLPLEGGLWFPVPHPKLRGNKPPCRRLNKLDFRVMQITENTDIPSMNA